MGEAEAKAAIAAAIKEIGAASPKDMGKVMGVLKARYVGQMDFGKASGLVKDLLKPVWLSGARFEALGLRFA